MIWLEWLGVSAVLLAIALGFERGWVRAVHKLMERASRHG